MQRSGPSRQCESSSSKVDMAWSCWYPAPLIQTRHCALPLASAHKQLCKQKNLLVPQNMAKRKYHQVAPRSIRKCSGNARVKPQRPCEQTRICATKRRKSCTWRIQPQQLKARSLFTQIIPTDPNPGLCKSSTSCGQFACHVTYWLRDHKLSVLYWNFTTSFLSYSFKINTKNFANDRRRLSDLARSFLQRPRNSPMLEYLREFVLRVQA